MFDPATPRRSRFTALAALLGLLSCTFAMAAEVATTAEAPDSLSAALDLAMVRGYLPSALPAMQIRDEAPAAARWLASPPTLAISHLESDQRRGTDETEVSLSFPFKSPLQRRSDRALDAVDPRLDAAGERYRRWYLSGTLRDLYARYRQALVMVEAERRAVEILAGFEDQLVEGFGAGAVERYDLLAVQRMRADAEGRRERRLAESHGALRLYQSLTGATVFPHNAGDNAPLAREPRYQDHPELALLALNEARDVEALRAASPATTPWRLALVGREFDIPEFSERQLGVALEIPLSFGDRVAPSTRSSASALRRTYALQRDQRLAELQLAWASLQAERSALIARQQRLQTSAQTDDLDALIESTRRSVELPIEVRLQRLLALIDMQLLPRRLAADLDANAAALRQLAGLSL